MELATFHELLSPAGQDLLARATALPDLREETVLRALTALRRNAPHDLARAAVETVLLRRRAASKFAGAGAMYFTRDALEQASSERVARYRAARYAGCPVVADLGCGIGGDTIALAGVAGAVVAVDRDPLRLAMARANAEACGLGGRVRFMLADLRAAAPALVRDAGAAFFDPARRTAAGVRTFSVLAYEPPLSVLHEWLGLGTAPRLGVKVSPGVDLAAIERLGLDCEVEFISVAGELREAALWFGPLRTAPRRATVLPGGDSMAGPVASPATVAPPGRYLIEPDPSVYRAGLLADLAARLGAWQIDREIAYLSADAPPHSPFARAWAVEEVLPFSVKGVRRRLRELGVGSVTVKKRGSPLDPQQFERMLRLDGTEHRTVVLTHAAGRPVAIICAAGALPSFYGRKAER
jgi:SAM-dependent methyltransferase